MNYPVWEVPFIGSTWIIGIIACVHIFVSHFAVGGGIFFAVTETLAYKRRDIKLYDYLKKHSLFFLLLTSVFGAVTGVGIWWAISLVNPNATHTLIQTYTLGWAEEYLFFVMELATFFVYYYTWHRLPRKTHLQLAWFYAFSSVMTLVIINGILTFMLTPGNWLNSRYWLEGFFNETYWPSLIMRLLIMAALAGMYALVTSAQIKGDDAYRTKMLRYSAKWFLPVFFIGPMVAFWYFSNVPGEVIQTINSGIQASGIGNFSILTRATYLSLILSGTLLIFVFVGPYLNPKGFSFRMALAFLMLGLLVTSISEWTREMLRKPYVVYNYMYSNGLRKDDVALINKQGFVSVARWVNPKNMTKHALGQAMFRYQCMSCHTQTGYRSMTTLLGERDVAAIGNFLALMKETTPEKNPYHGIMPPVVGTAEELDALAQYLATINHPPQSE